MNDKPILVERRCPQGQDEHSCFIFSAFSRRTYFRIYDPVDERSRSSPAHRSRPKSQFTDWKVASGVTPFVRFKFPDDVELKTWKHPDGRLERVMDFPDHALSCGEPPPLKPGEVWTSPELTKEDIEDDQEQRAWARAGRRSLARFFKDEEAGETDEKARAFRLKRLDTELHWAFEHLAEIKVELGADPLASGSALKDAVRAKLGEDAAMYFDYLDDAISQARECFDELSRLLRKEQRPGTAS